MLEKCLKVRTAWPETCHGIVSSGKDRKRNPCTSVKVNFSNARTASHVLTQARKLVHFDKLKSVFICPD